MKRFHIFLAALLLGLATLGAQAQQPAADDDLAVEAPAAQDRAGRQGRGPRAGGTTLRDAQQAMRDRDLAKARTLVDEVIRKQPNNPRAHFVKAQIASRDQDLATARASLQEAERLAPGLPFAREQAVTNLRTRLERLEAREGRGERPRAGRNGRDGDLARPTQGPADTTTASTSSDASPTPSAGANAAPTGPAVETRPAGEETRNMGAASRKDAEGGNSLVLGIAIGGILAAIAGALFFRRRRPTA